MKYIKKGIEPASLTEFRAAGGKHFDDYRGKVELSRKLMEEQGFICCYCMQRIKPETVHIEHWKPQSLFPEFQLNYKNLLAVCDGNEGQPKHLQHCDRRKGNTGITVNPMEPQCESFVKFGTNGEVYSDDETVSRELTGVLNLNNQALVINRKNVLDFVIRKLMAENREGAWSKAVLRKEIRKWEDTGTDGKYEPFCRIVIFHLKKKLAKSL